ncbi:hypothetical protein M1145_00585 [Patescibacteria group bacterium]|nr:hypothetical protein [Patescibacteria group bacterium]
METLEHSLGLNQTRVYGQHEPMVTDTVRLAGELSTPQDVSRLIIDFDNGITPLRDVGGMFTAQRMAILEAYQSGNIDIDKMESMHPEMLSTPVMNLHERVVSGNQDQPVGHNFFVNATGFLDAHLPWAEQFDNLLRTRAGVSLYDIDRSDDKLGKDRLLSVITDNHDRELTKTLAVYLAGRSLEGEKYLKHHYGHALESAKNQIYVTTQQIGETTGMRIDMLERVAGQLYRATFGSFDHLHGLVTSDNTGVVGDYLPGSLRIEVQFDGSIRSARLREGSDAHHVIAHELQHASSAQTGLRCGLRISKQGLEVDEGMTEYLTQLSIGAPGIEHSANGTMKISYDVPYREAVFAMMVLHEQFKFEKNMYFSTLFNAYHGDVMSQRQLESALYEFYRLNLVISQSLS